MTNRELNCFAAQIVKVIADPGIYRQVNITLAKERAKLPVRGLEGGLQKPKRLHGGVRRHGRWIVLN